MKLRPQPDALTRLEAQRDALTKRLQDAEQKLERLDDLDAAELIVLEDELSTTRRTLSLVAERITAAEQEARQAATAAALEAQRKALAPAWAEYEESQREVADLTISLGKALVKLAASGRQLRSLGAVDDREGMSFPGVLATAVNAALSYWRANRPDLLGLPARNLAAERQAAARYEAAHRLEVARLRLETIRRAASTTGAPPGMLDATRDDAERAAAAVNAFQ